MLFEWRSSLRVLYFWNCVWVAYALYEYSKRIDTNKGNLRKKLENKGRNERDASRRFCCAVDSTIWIIEMPSCVRIKTEVDAPRHRRAFRAVQQRRIVLSPRLAILGISRFTDCIWHLVSGREKHEPAFRALSFRATPVGRRSKRKNKEEVRREIRRTIRRKLDAFISRDFLSCSGGATLLVLFFSLLFSRPIRSSLPPYDEPSPRPKDRNDFSRTNIRTFKIFGLSIDCHRSTGCRKVSNFFVPK